MSGGMDSSKHSQRHTDEGCVSRREWLDFLCLDSGVERDRKASTQELHTGIDT